MKDRRLVLAGDNYFASLDPSQGPRSMLSQLHTLVARFAPSRPVSTSEDKYFCSKARALCVFMVLKELHDGRKPTLPGIAKYLVSSSVEIERLFTEAEDSCLAGGQYRDLGRSMNRLCVDAPMEFAGVIGFAQQAVNSIVGLNSVVTIQPFNPFNEDKSHETEESP